MLFQILDFLLVRQVASNNLIERSCLKHLEYQKHVVVVEGGSLAVLVHALHEVNQGFVEMAPLEVILKFWVLFEEGLDKRQHCGRDVQRVHQNFHSIVDVEVVNHVLIF